MAEKTHRLTAVAKKLHVGIKTIADFLTSKGFDTDGKPNAKINDEQYNLLIKEYKADMEVGQEAQEMTIGGSHANVVIDSKGDREDDKKEDLFDATDEKAVVVPKKEEVKPVVEEKKATKPIVETPKQEEEIKKETPAKKEEAPAKEEKVVEPVAEKEKKEEDAGKLIGLKVVGKIELDSKGRPIKKKAEPAPRKEVTKPIAKKEEKPAEKKTPKVEAKATPKQEVKKEQAPVKVEKEPIPKKEVEKVPVAKVETTKPVEKEVETPIKQEKAETKKETPIKEDNKPKVEIPKVVAKEEEVVKADSEVENTTPEKTIEAKADKLQGLKVIGKIELPVEKKRGGAKRGGASSDEKRKRKRVRKSKGVPIPNENKGKTTPSTDKKTTTTTRGGKKKEEVSGKAVDEAYKKTMARMSGGGSSSGGSRRGNKGKYRREKRAAGAEQREQQMLQEEKEAQILKVTEFISTSELAVLMDVDVNTVILKTFSLGMVISINQRLDAEAITIIADEFGFDVEFTSAEEEIDIVIAEPDKEEDLVTRAPIVTIMGHVDHGKTSLLDYIRSASVVEGEAGGITQHIGAYDVITPSGRRVAFLDTPGHEAFTAMRARGAKVTDVVIIVIAADDSVMPQTIEAINHAQVAGVPFVVAYNKMDKSTANVDKIKAELSNMNVLVESWGGKVQEQEISAKTGQGVDDLLEIVLLESDILDLKANPNKNAVGSIVEASLDKGKGYVSTVLIEGGTLKIGDTILAGSYHGRVKAMTDHRGQKMKEVGPATPVQVLGLNGAPQAGDKFNVMESEREARDIATKRSQIMREQTIRATKRTTLSDLGRRIALGNFHQLNIILKGDVDGSIEALSDSLQKLSTDEIEVNIIHKAVGPISESDVLLATASDAIS
jgi:translation initiation factor IF-2